MASSRNSSSTRAEIDHSKPRDHPILKLNIESYSEPMHYRHYTAQKLLCENNSYNGAPSTESNREMRMNFSDFVDTHRQFSFEFENKNKNNVISQNKYRRTVDIESESDSDSEPSPTPIISDLEDVVCDTPNIQRVMTASDGNEIQPISIPYNFDDEDSDTPEPLDTPVTPGIEYNLEELKLSSDDEYDDDDDDMDIDYAFIVDEVPPALFPALSPKSRSWQHITMTKMNYKRCKRIKSITPITQQMAEWTINNVYARRRSVANITPTVHRLFKLDPDLLKIREEFLEKHNKTKLNNEPEYEHEYEDEYENEERMNDRTKTERFCVKVNRIKIPKYK